MYNGIVEAFCRVNTVLASVGYTYVADELTDS